MLLVRMLLEKQSIRREINKLQAGPNIKHLFGLQLFLAVSCLKGVQFNVVYPCYPLGHFTL